MLKVAFLGSFPGISKPCLLELLRRSDVEVVAVVPNPENPLEASVPMVSHWRDLEQIEFDLGLSVMYVLRVHQVLLDMPRLGIINFHPAPLPGFRGRNGVCHAIMQKLTHYGATAHYMDAQLDTGPIIDCETVSILPDDTALALRRRTLEALYTLFCRVVPKAVTSDVRLSAKKQDPGGRYYSLADLKDPKADLRWPPDEFDRFVRATYLPPSLGAYVEIPGAMYRITPVNAIEFGDGGEETRRVLGGYLREIGSQIELDRYNVIPFVG